MGSAIYTDKLEGLRATAASAGCHKQLLWTLNDLLRDPIAQQFAQELMVLRQNYTRKKTRHPDHRPFCAAFKPIVIWRALMQSREGDYVLWADASKYHSTQLPARSVTKAIAALASIGNGYTAAAGAGAGYAAASHVLPGGSGGARPPAESRNVSPAWRYTRWYQQHKQARSWPPKAIGSAFGLVHCNTMSCTEGQQMRNHVRTAINRATAKALVELWEPAGRSVTNKVLTACTLTLHSHPALLPCALTLHSYPKSEMITPASSTNHPGVTAATEPCHPSL